MCGPKVAIAFHPWGSGPGACNRTASAGESESHLDRLVESVPASRMDYAQILSGLFVGSHPRAAGDVERLRRESAVTAVLNLQTDEDMRSVNLDWQPLEAHYRASG